MFRNLQGRHLAVKKKKKVRTQESGFRRQEECDKEKKEEDWIPAGVYPGLDPGPE
jgi:hypothetical protein